MRGSAIASAAHHDDVMDRRKNNTFYILLFVCLSPAIEKPGEVGQE